MYQNLNKLIIASAAVLIAFAPAAYAAKVSEARDVAEFTEIKSLGSSDVIVQVGKKQDVRVEAEDDEIQDIITEVKGDTLVIRRKSKKGFINVNHSATIYVSVPSLTAFVSQGSGDGDITGLNQDRFRLKQMGSGDVSLEGKCKSADIASQGSGELSSNSFVCDEVELDQMGSGDVEFDRLVTKSIEVGSHGSGDMMIAGSCDDLTIKNHGSGRTNAKSFECKEVEITSFGSGGVDAFATGDVSVKTMGSGRVNIYGGGKIVELSSSGSGRIKVHKP